MYPLPDIDDTYYASRDIPREIFKEASIEVNEDDVACQTPLTRSSGLHTMRSCPRLIPRTGVSSLWMVLAGPERLICT